MADYATFVWPTEPRRDTFQPEPGCSEPTFRGSQAEVGALAQLMPLRAVARIDAEAVDGAAFAVALPTLERPVRNRTRAP